MCSRFYCQKYIVRSKDIFRNDVTQIAVSIIINKRTLYFTLYENVDNELFLFDLFQKLKLIS